MLKTLKSDSETRHIPTVAFHTKDAEEDPHTGRMLGALHTVEGPATADALELALTKLGDYVARRTRALLVVSNDSVDETSAVVALFGAMPDVDLHVMAAGTDGALLQASVARGARGLVVEGTGCGNIPPTALPGLKAARAAGLPVVLVSRSTSFW